MVGRGKLTGWGAVRGDGAIKEVTFAGHKRNTAPLTHPRNAPVSTTQKIGVNQLQIGMYVAQLDRPWLETPFLFQGFYIRDQDEIRDLQAYCDYVYILREDEPGAASSGHGMRDRMADGPRGEGPLPTGRRWFRLPAVFRRTQGRKKPRADAALVEEPQYTRPGMFYQDTESIENELKTATAIHDDAVFTVHEVMDNLRTSDKLDVQRLESAVTPMVDSILRNPAALSCLVRLQQKDDYLYHHSLACLVWATILGRHIGLSHEDLNVIALGALLLDVGKTRVPDELLHKPETLDAQEMALMRAHVEFGLEILDETGDVDSRVKEMVAHHHERYDGTGYPDGLKGNQIPVFGRIAGIVDAYDAMITPRPYAQPMSSYEAFRQLRSLADIEFQAELIDQFTQAIGVFPTGTLVELNTGEVAVVTRQNRVRRLRPEIMVIMDGEKEIMQSFSVLDLNNESFDEQGRRSVWIERGLAPGSFGIDPTEFFLD